MSPRVVSTDRRLARGPARGRRLAAVDSCAAGRSGVPPTAARRSLRMPPTETRGAMAAAAAAAGGREADGGARGVALRARAGGGRDAGVCATDGGGADARPSGSADAAREMLWRRVGRRGVFAAVPRRPVIAMVLATRRAPSSRLPVGPSNAQRDASRKYERLHHVPAPVPPVPTLTSIRETSDKRETLDAPTTSGPRRTRDAPQSGCPLPPQRRSWPFRQGCRTWQPGPGMVCGCAVGLKVKIVAPKHRFLGCRT